MSREHIRSLKHAVRKGLEANQEAPRLLGRDSALALLARSISFGHGRLAVLRLCVAVETGATVPGEHWQYCLRVVTRDRDRQLQELYRSAVAKAGTPALAMNA